MKTSQFLLAFGLIATASAMCPNSCSTHGQCGQFDKCECHQNWQGADCSRRTCAFELAWVDVGTDNDDAHYYAECANKGTCDRKTGECKCFDGYEGKGCRRSTCPNECSGHGTCEFIDELIMDVEYKRTKDYNSGLRVESSFKDSTASNAHLSDRTGNEYTLWDAGKIQGCQCDANWEGPDCSSRTCPRGDDPLTTQINADSFSTYVARQVLQIGVAAGTAEQTVAVNDEFDLTYYDLYGGKWRTQAIQIETDEADTAASIQTQLRALPNKVMEGVQVYPTVDASTYFGSAIATLTKDWISFTTWDGDADCDTATQQCFAIEFANKPGTSGRQYLLEFDGTVKSAGTGFQPVSAGTAQVDVTGTVFEWVDVEGVVTLDQHYNDGRTTEAAYCSNRGLCDQNTGICECFSGYRGLACQEQEALT